LLADNLSQAPFTGRINLIAPFFPFSASENAVLAHKFILALADKVRQPINLTPSIKRYIGHVHLSVPDDGRVCADIAKAYYHAETGARSLYHAVNNVVRDALFDAYCDDQELVRESINEGPLRRFAVKAKPVKTGVSEVRVLRDGFLKIKGSQDKVKLEKLDNGEDLGEVV